MKLLPEIKIKTDRSHETSIQVTSNGDPTEEDFSTNSPKRKIQGNKYRENTFLFLFLYTFISFTFQGWIRYRSFCSGRTPGALVKTIKYLKFRIILVIPICNLTLHLTLPYFLLYLSIRPTLPYRMSYLTFTLPYVLPYHTLPYLICYLTLPYESYLLPYLTLRLALPFLTCYLTFP